MVRHVHLRMALAAMATTMMGIGLARFSYSPIAAALVDDGVLTPADVTRIGAALLAAYVIGAFVAHRVGASFGDAPPIRAALVACVVLLAIEGSLDSPWMIAAGRAMMNALGAVLMVLGPTAAMRAVGIEARPGISAVAFAGVGVGAVASGRVVAVIAGHADSAWISPAIAVLGLVAVALGWGPWPRRDAADVAPPEPHSGSGIARAVTLIAIAWAADAWGYIPHGIYFSDYVSSELGRGVVASGLFWSAFGFGTIGGPFLTAALFRRVGGKTALITAFAAKAAAVALVAAVTTPVALIASAAVVGILTSGMGALFTMALAERVDASQLSRVWGRLTGLFAVAQGAAAFAAAWAYSVFGAYQSLFLFAAGALGIGAAVLALMPPASRR